MVAAVLNRQGSLGPAPGKRSRGELPLLALREASAAAAAQAIARLDAGAWRSFNMVLADRGGAIFVRGLGHGHPAAEALPPGLHMVTSRDPNDHHSPRVQRHLPRLRAAAAPDTDGWAAWRAIMADRSGRGGGADERGAARRIRDGVFVAGGAAGGWGGELAVCRRAAG